MDREASLERGSEAKESHTPSEKSLESGCERKPHEFNEQTNYVPKSTIITVYQNREGMMTEANSRQIFLACSAVDFLALIDQTTLAASLTIVSNALNAGDEQSWIAGAYFV